MSKKTKLPKEKVLITLVLILSSVLNFANIGIEGYANTFYSAGVKSMMMNLKNFFFASFDPSGFVTIDKPPLGFWIQTVFAKIFGFSGWSIILPQAIAGVLSVWLLYHLVKKSFGTAAGLIAALSLTVTPIFVAASRNNTIDNLLVLSLILACWALLIAAENGKFKYLILSLVIVGIGFNIKMVEAYMVAPALYITYLLSASLPLKKKIKHLALGTIILLTVSLSWAIIVDLIPANNRPYIGSSTNNSVIQLIVGHNGLQRVGLGQGRQNSFKNQSNKFTTYSNNSNHKMHRNNSRNFAQSAKYGMGQRNSNTSILRLISKNNMSDQISWLLPFALIGFVVAAIEESFKMPFDNKRKISLLLWFTWLLPEFIYFSFSKNITHTYYLTTMAPSIAALVGIGMSSMWKLFKEDGFKKWILPSALIINSLIEILILSYNYNTSNGYKIVIWATGLLGILSAMFLIIINISKKNNIKLNKIIIATAFTGIFIPPIVWSFTPMFHQMNGSSPSAGLELFKSKQQDYNMTAATTDVSKLIKFLEANQKNEKYLVEVPSAMTYGSDLILKTGNPILTLGGFSGSDPILTLNQFKQLVSNRAIRYAIVNASTRRGAGFGGLTGSNSSNNAIMNWIKTNGNLVPDAEWKSSSENSNLKIGNKTNSVKLYDLKPNK